MHVVSRAKGTGNTVASESERQEVRAAIAELRKAGWSKTKIAKKSSVTRPALDKWIDGSTFPKKRNWENLMLLVEQFRSGATADAPRRLRAATKVSPHSSGDVADASSKDIDSAVQRSPDGTTPKEAGRMGAIVASVLRGQRPEWVIHLEICVEYHADEIEAGAISHTVIGMARDGAFEADGCSSWTPRRWWQELQARDPRTPTSVTRIKSRGPDGH